MTRDVPLPVQLAAAGPARQRRWTVLIRWIMLIPHYVVLYFLNIAFAVVAFIGWWGALFTGRLPEFAASYLSGFIRWSTRVQAYALLLTDQYPPFSLGDEPGYPVRIAIPPRDRLNRAAVLFRVILAIPASLLNGLVTYGGMTIVAFIAWLIALITGKLPTSLHQAYTAILRYGTRLNCYFYMLTAVYPGGLFGDGPAVPPAAAAPPAGDLDPAASGDEASVDAAAPGEEASVDLAAPGDETPGDETPVDAEAPGEEASVDAEAPGEEAYVDLAVLGYEAPDDLAVPGYETLVVLAAGQPADWRLLLTRGAKQLLGWFIGIGAVLWVAGSVVGAINASGNVISAKDAIHAVTAAKTTLSTELKNYGTASQACANAACAETADAQAATALTNFASTVHGTPMPASAVAAANTVYSDATKVAQDLTQLSRLGPSVSSTQYNSTATSIGIAQDSSQFQQDLNALDDALNSSG
jgi:hypothetical protein